MHAEEHMDAMRKPRDLEFESPQVAMDLAITAICANAHAKASDPSTTPAELKELALAIGGLIGSAQPGDVQLVEARATVAILETELVKARQVAAENGAACDALKAELAKVKEKLSMRESTAAVHVLLDTLRIPEGQLWDRIKCIEVVRNRLDAAGFNDDDMSQAVRDALLVAATAKRLAFEVETIRQNQNNIVGEKVAEVLDERSKEIDRADAPKVSFAARVKWLVDELLRLKDASRVDDVNRIHKVLDDAKVPAGHIVERVKELAWWRNGIIATLSGGVPGYEDEWTLKLAQRFAKHNELLRVLTRVHGMIGQEYLNHFAPDHVKSSDDAWSDIKPEEATKPIGVALEGGQKGELTAVEFTPEGGNIVARAMAPASVSAKVEYTHKRFGEF